MVAVASDLVAGAVQRKVDELAPVAVPILAVQVPAALPVRSTCSPTPTRVRLLAAPDGAAFTVALVMARGFAVVVGAEGVVVGEVGVAGDVAGGVGFAGVCPGPLGAACVGGGDGDFCVGVPLSPTNFFVSSPASRAVEPEGRFFADALTPSACLASCTPRESLSGAKIGSLAKL